MLTEIYIETLLVDEEVAGSGPRGLSLLGYVALRTVAPGVGVRCVGLISPHSHGLSNKKNSRIRWNPCSNYLTRWTTSLSLRRSVCGARYLGGQRNDGKSPDHLTKVPSSICFLKGPKATVLRFLRDTFVVAKSHILFNYLNPFPECNATGNFFCCFLGIGVIPSCIHVVRTRYA